MTSPGQKLSLIHPWNWRGTWFHVWWMNNWKRSCCSSLSHIRLFVTPMDYSTPDFPVLHHLQELSQTHVHWDRDAIQLSHPLLSPSALALNLSQHQRLFQWVNSSHHVAKGLKLWLHHQSIQWMFRVDFLKDWLVWSPSYPRDSQEFSPAPQFESINSFVLRLHDMVQLSYPYKTSEKTNIAFTTWTFVKKVMSLLVNRLSRFVITFFPQVTSVF